jgi:hypothetical protein
MISLILPTFAFLCVPLRFLVNHPAPPYDASGIERYRGKRRALLIRNQQLLRLLRGKCQFGTWSINWIRKIAGLARFRSLMKVQTDAIDVVKYLYMEACTNIRFTPKSTQIPL